MAEVYLGLGSNLGDKAGNLREALRLLTREEGGQPGLSTEGQARLSPTVTLLSVSSLYRTEPVGYLDQDWFLNAVARVETRLSPREMLRRILVVEHELGRVRTVRNGPRSIDLDILLWGQLVADEDDLVIPHPRLQERLFVLEPLAEIAPDARHPVLDMTIAECRAKLATAQGVLRIEGPEWGDAPGPRGLSSARSGC